MIAFYYLILLTSFYLYLAGITFFSYDYFLFPMIVFGISAVFHLLITKWKKLSLPLIAVIAFLTYIITNSIAQMIFLIIPMIFDFVVIEKKLIPSYEGCRTQFIVGLIVLFGFSLIDVIADTGNTYLVFMVIYAVSGVCLLRTMRIGQIRNEKEFQKQNLIGLIGAGIVAIPFSLPQFYYFLKRCVIWIYVRIFYPVIYFLLNLFHDTAKRIDENIDLFDLDIQRSSEDSSSSMMDEISEKNVEVVWKNLDSKTIWILRIFTILIVVLIVFLLVRYFKNQKKWHPAYQSEGVQYQREAIEEENIPRGNRGKIRKIYRQYLKQLKEKQIHLETSYTSDDVLHQNAIYENESKMDAETMRNLYLKARYDMNCEIKRSDVSQMKKSYSQWKKKMQSAN